MSRQRHPNQVSPYGRFKPRQEKKPQTSYERTVERRAADVEALAALQASRPAKPPGRR